jgi:hypothetical protein
MTDNERIAMTRWHHWLDRTAILFLHPKQIAYLKTTLPKDYDYYRHLLYYC